MKSGVWWVFAAGESVCQGTLCAKHHTLAIEGVLSGVRRAHTLHAGVGRMACGGSVLRASLHRCQVTLCAMHQTLEVIGVLSGVRRAHFMPVFEEWRVVGLCYGRVCVSGHAVRHAPDTGSNRCPLRGEEETLHAVV